MMKINSDGSVQTVTSSIVFHAFKELNDRQKQAFIKLLLDYTSTMDRAEKQELKLNLDSLCNYGGYLKRSFK